MNREEFWREVKELWFRLSWEEYEKMDREDQVAFDFVATHTRERELTDFFDKRHELGVFRKGIGKTVNQYGEEKVE
jgi:hypothetical protein